MEVHTIPPIFDYNSKVLILGSFPSVKSREQQFYYGHPQNRFWRLMAKLFDSEIPKTNVEKTELLLKNNLALWDVIASCDVSGSDDASIRNVIPNDLNTITSNAAIRNVFTNGGKSFELYNRYCLKQTGMTAIKLPSTSPANARSDIDTLVRAWSVLKDALK